MNAFAMRAFDSVEMFHTSLCFFLEYVVCMEGIWGRTREVQVIDGVDDDAH